MKLFADTADIEELKQLQETGLIDGVTTNPSLLSKIKGDPVKTLESICDLIKGPISAEVIAIETEKMVKEALTLRKIAENIVIKIPLTLNGLKATRILSQQGHPVNVTLCFSANQALLAAKSGAKYISPFIGRLDDISTDGLQLIADIRQIFDHYSELSTQILTASVRHVEHIRQAALIGSDALTLPPDLLYKMVQHPLTDKGLDIFLSDWRKSHQAFV